MPAPEPPVVDPRLPADLAQWLAQRARSEVPEWRPPPGGDPGTALHQVLAAMVGHVVERVNRVPTHAFRSFLQAAGVQTLAPQPATAAVTFGLAPGRGTTVVPAGTHIEAPEDEGRGPVVFETDADLTVLPVRLPVIEVWDPLSDRETSVGAVGGEGFAAFSGEEAVRHELAVTSSSFGAAETGSHLSLVLVLASSLGAIELADLASTVSLELRNALGATVPLTSTVSALRTGASTVRVEATATSTGVPTSLLLVVEGTLAEHPFSRECTLKSVQLSVDVDRRAPSAVMVDGAPVDPSLAFAALGEIPRAGSELAIADPLLGVAGATVTLDLALDPGVAKSAVLEWEWYDGTAWHPFEQPVADDTAALTRSGTMTISTQGVPLADLQGNRGCWMRVRLASGGYGRPRAYVPINPDDLRAGLKVEPGTGDLDAPRVLSLGVQANASDTAPQVLRRTGRHVVPAIGEPLTTGLDGIGPTAGTRGQAVVLGMDGDPGNAQLSMHLSVVDPPPAPRGRSPRTGRIPLRWEYLDGRLWQPLTVVDGSEGMTRTGVVSFLAPRGMAPTALPGRGELRWVRAVAVEPLAPAESPRLAAVTLNAVPVTAGQTVSWEPLGQSDGRESARFQLVGRPVMPGQRLLVAEADPPPVAASPAGQADRPDAVMWRVDEATGQPRAWVAWQEVRTLGLSQPGDRHYVVDRASGEIVFGDGAQGMAPPRGAALAASYRHGPGAAGNVLASSLSRMRSSVPGIATVRGVQDADGGSDPGGATEVERRGPVALQHRGRAVTGKELCAAASEAAGGRVARCILSTTDDRGQVTLVVVPSAPDDPAPNPSPTLRSVIERDLARRAAVGLQLDAGIQVSGPSYRQVRVSTEVVPENPDEAEQVKASALNALTRFVHALTGGPAGGGWPLGRNVFESEIAQVLSAVPGVASVRSIRLSSAAAAQRLHLTAPLQVGPGLPVGAVVTGREGRLVWTLDEPLPPGSRADVLVVRGLTEGDRVHVIADGTVVAREALDGGAGRLSLKLDPTLEAVVVFPIHAVLLTSDGTAVFRTTRPVAVQPSVSDFTLEGHPLGGLPAVSTRLSLVHPAGLRVVDVASAPDGGDVTIGLVADVTDHVVPGAVLGLVGHPARTPVLTASAAPGALQLTAPSWEAGDLVRLGDVRKPQRGVIARTRTLDDVVHVDPASLVWSGAHIIDVVAR